MSECRDKRLDRSDPKVGLWPSASLLGGLETGTRQEFLTLGTLCEVESGRVLLREGEDSDHVVLLLDGCVKVIASTEEGNLALLDIRVGGDLVGELASLDERPRSATVIAAGPAVVRIIRRADFIAFLERHPDASIAVGKGIAAKLRWATRRRIDFGGCSVQVRLARVLVELVDSYGEPAPGGTVIATSLTQPELAALVGAAEPTVHKALASLRRSGALATGYRRILVRDRATLEAMGVLAYRNPS